MNSQSAMVGLGLMPGDRWLTDEEIAAVDERISERRKDTEFQQRLERRIEEDLPVLEALAGPDEPVRLWRRGLAWLRLRAKRRGKLRARRRPRGVDFT